MIHAFGASPEAELLFDVRCAVGESPLWDVRRGRLWWVDADKGALWWADLDGSPPEHVSLDPAPSFLALTASGTLCVAAGRGWHCYDHDKRALVELARPASAPSADWRLNDGVVDAGGRIWTGSIGLPRSDKPNGALFRFADDGVHVLADDLLTQNGLAISPGGTTLYLADSHPSRAIIWAHDLDPDTGQIASRRVFHACKGGRPDGAAMDVEGGYWFALIDGGQILRLDADGSVTHRVNVPVSRPTNLCFGGPDMRRCFITSMRAGLGDADLARQPLAGGIFSIEAPIAGVPVPHAGEFAELAPSQRNGRNAAHFEITVETSK
jgi:sugar lactone lactonase YvrE